MRLHREFIHLDDQTFSKRGRGGCAAVCLERENVANASELLQCRPTIRALKMVWRASGVVSRPTQVTASRRSTCSLSRRDENTKRATIYYRLGGKNKVSVQRNLPILGQECTSIERH
jgi:hypothetical protein